MNTRQVLTEVMLLLVFSVIAGTGSNLLRTGTTRLAWFGDYELPGSAPGTLSPSSDPHAAAPLKDPAQIFLVIDGAAAERLHKAGAVFIDARRSAVYEDGHIAGARSIAVWEQDTDSRINDLSIGKLPLDSIVVIYCSGGNCTDSEMLAQKMALSGFYNLYVYQQGFPDWVKRGGAVIRGAKP